MPAKVAFTEAKKLYESKFPNNKLIKFESASRPCSILCYKHGLVEDLGFRNLRLSKFGCPKCARDHRRRGVDAKIKQYLDINSSESLNQIKKFSDTVPRRTDKTRRSKSCTLAESPLECSSKGSTAKHALNNKARTEQLSSSHVQPVFDDKLEDLPKSNFALVPYHSDVKVAAGLGRFNNTLATLPIPLSLPELQKLGVQPNNIICCRIIDDSMDPILQDGTLVGIDTAETEIRSGKIYAFIDHNGWSHIRILIKTDDSRIKIHSYNYSYETEIVTPESIHVIGRLFWAASIF
jgi:phage repressor protein C with HTH and peptisase S24 domain